MDLAWRLLSEERWEKVRAGRVCGMLTEKASGLLFCGKQERYYKEERRKVNNTWKEKSPSLYHLKWKSGSRRAIVKTAPVHFVHQGYERTWEMWRDCLLLTHYCIINMIFTLFRKKFLAKKINIVFLAASLSWGLCLWREKGEGRGGKGGIISAVLITQITIILLLAQMPTVHLLYCLVFSCNTFTSRN